MQGAWQQQGAASRNLLFSVTRGNGHVEDTSVDTFGAGGGERWQVGGVRQEAVVDDTAWHNNTHTHTHSQMFAVNACDSRQPQFAILAHVPSKDTLTYTHTHTHTPTYTNRLKYTPTHTHTPPASAAVVVIMRLGRHTKCEREKNCGASHKVAKEMHYRMNGKFCKEINICGIDLALNT